ncbi:DUF981 family protein [Thermoproteus uzoniensis]|nr:DUF981 domain-containing protein [Thermoproteus uzoniensis]
MPLFMDPLDLWLDVLGTTLLATAYWLYLNFASKASSAVKLAFNKAFGYFYIALGVYALASGLWATATWPFPSSYNLIFSDAWPIFGVALILLGLTSNRIGVEALGEDGLYYLRGALVGVAALSLAPFVYSFDIWKYGLTNEPPLAGLLFFAVGLAGLLSPLLTFKKAARGVAYLLMLLLVIGGLISLFIGVSAIFAHTAAWKAWAPWYGAH